MANKAFGRSLYNRDFDGNKVHVYYNQLEVFIMSHLFTVPCSLMLSGQLVWCRRVERSAEGKRQPATKRQRTLNSAVMTNGN